MAASTGATQIARALKSLGVTTIFGIVGIPVVQVAEAAIDLGIRFIGFRNEQAAGYAAGAYGYLTGRPGVCLVVGGPGVLHAIAGVGNATVNAFPILLLAGSAETALVGRGAFQELDAVSLLKPQTKIAARPSSVETIPDTIRNAYRICWYGRPGAGFVDLPADLIMGLTSEEVEVDMDDAVSRGGIIQRPNGVMANNEKIARIAEMIRMAKAPLVVIGKGAAYARAEENIRNLIDRTQLFFLPTPMGKGVVTDSHPLNAAPARTRALKQADVVILLGARLNWILHFGDPPKWNPEARFVQINICAEEVVGGNPRDAELSIVGDVAVVVPQLVHELGSWTYDTRSAFGSNIRAGISNNISIAAFKAASDKIPMTFARAFKVIEQTLHQLSPPEEGGIVYVSEGANTMDISRSVFPLSHPRLRLDAGTYATMGVGLGYAIAAHAAYNRDSEYIDGIDGNKSQSRGPSFQQKKRKKIVALEGDSAFGFSAMEVETMSRYGMDILIFVMNNGGIYHGDSDSAREWLEMQAKTMGATIPTAGLSSGKPSMAGSGSIGRDSSEPIGPNTTGLRSTTLGWEVGYEKIAQACVGGTGHVVRTPEELEQATRAGFHAKGVCVINVMIESGKGQKLEFQWMVQEKKEAKAKAKETKL